MDDNLKRVNFGRVMINAASVGKYDIDDARFEGDLNVVIHECLHIFAFSNSLYRNWVNPETGEYYGY